MSSYVKTAVLAGSTGLVGSHLLRRLLADPGYGRIYALTRKALPVQHPKLTAVAASLETLPEALSDLRADDWFCAIGTTIKLAGSQEAFRRVDYDYPLAMGRQAAASGAKQFLLVSSIGASAESSVFYSRVKGETERDLAGLGLPRLHVFRPSVLLGDRTERRRGESAAIAVMKVFNPLVGGPLAKYRAVHADDVAAAMIRAAHEGGGNGVHVYDGKKLKGNGKNG